MTLEVVNIANRQGVRDPATELRRLADEIEAGAHGNAPRVIMMVGRRDGEQLMTHVRTAGGLLLWEALGIVACCKDQLMFPDEGFDGGA